MNFLDTTYKPLVQHHFFKLKFVKCYFEVNSSNLFPVNMYFWLYGINQRYSQAWAWLGIDIVNIHRFIIRRTKLSNKPGSYMLIYV